MGEMMSRGTWCLQCGQGVRIDEDGCCLHCGATAVGKGADRVFALLAEIDRLALRAWKEANS